MGVEKDFLEQYEIIKNDIENISSIMKNSNDISEINVTLAIKNIVNKFLKVMYFEHYGLSNEQIKNINNKIKEIKKLLIDLKNKQVYFYNLKVQEINDKIIMFKKVGLSSDLKDKLDKLELLKFNSIYLYKDWKNSNYSRLLDYDKLIEMNNIISDIEKSINFKDDEPLDLRVKISYCEEMLKKIKNEYRDDISLEEINTLLDRCISLFENVVDTDMLIRKYVYDGTLKKESEKNYRIITLYSELTKIKNKLLKKKKMDDFSDLKDRLYILNNESNKLQNIVFDYFGKSNNVIMKRFNVRLDSLKDVLSNIKRDIVKLKNDNKLDVNQVNQLDLEIEKVRVLFDKFNEQLKNPYMLESNFNEYLNNVMMNLSRELGGLENEVENLDKSLKDISKLEKINSIIVKKKIEIQYLENHLIDNKFSGLELRNNLKEIKDRFNGICDLYNSRRPLSIKKIRSADNFYEKYSKECLYASGLSTLALLYRSPLIPAIMNGITVMSLKTPILGRFVNSINNILGGMINAKRDENGKWFLSNGIEIDPAVSVTSLLQGVVLSKITNASLVKRIVNIGKKMNLKYRKVLDIPDVFKRVKENKVGGSIKI